MAGVVAEPPEVDVGSGVAPRPGVLGVGPANGPSVGPATVSAVAAGLGVSPNTEVGPGVVGVAPSGAPAPSEEHPTSSSDTNPARITAPLVRCQMDRLNPTELSTGNGTK